jgi:N6-L-threonylcarbamoyladenine synthase
MNKNLFLGIDTSCYTTSIGVVDDQNQLIINKRKLLKVKSGKQGLRQSEAFFQHGSNLVNLYEELLLEIDIERIKCISVSTQPRNLEESYMPVFLSGYQFAKTIGLTLGRKVKAFSHQEGHIMASLMTSDLTVKKEMKFYSLHLSGGTTELLLCHMKDNRIISEIIGGSLDLSAGQLIDRVGVKMGLQFPCGKVMDDLSNQSTMDDLYPISVKGLYFNLSGLESYGYKKLEEKSKADHARSLLLSLSETIVKTLNNLDQDYPILLTGGVSANSILRKALKKRNDNVYFGEKSLSTDNAVGIAELGKLG